MFSEIVFTGTVNVGNIAVAVVTLISVVTAYYKLRLDNERVRTLVTRENQKTRDCIHALPYHPENPEGRANPPIE